MTSPATYPLGIYHWTTEIPHAYSEYTLNNQKLTLFVGVLRFTWGLQMTLYAL